VRQDAEPSREASPRVSTRGFLAIARVAVCIVAALGSSTAFGQTTRTWSGTTSNAWATTTNWNGGVVPGATSGTTNTNYAVFNTNPSNRSPTWTTYLNLAGFTSGSGAGAYTIGTTSGSSAFLTSGGTTSIAVGVANSQTINAPLVILNASGSSSGSYTFLNSTTTNNTRLVLGGAISGQATTGGTTSISFTANRPSTSNSTTLDVISGAISDGTAGGKLALTKSGSSVLILTGSNSYTGGTTITDAGSMLTFGGTTSLPATGTVTVAAGSGIGLRVGGSGFTAADVGNLFAGTMTNVSNNANSNVGIDTANGDFTYASSIAGTRGLVKLGTNKLTLSASNSFSGGASLLQGTVELGNAAALGSGTVTLFGGLQASTPLTGANKVMNPLVIAGAQASWAQTTINSTNDIEFGGPVTWSPANTVFFTGAGTVTFSGSVTLTAGSAWGNGGGQSNVTISGPISGNQNLSWANDATLTLSGSNSFTGSLNAQGASTASTISFSSANAVNSSSQIRFVGGRLLYTGTGDTVTRPMTLGVNSTTTGTATLDQSGTGLLIYSGALTTGGSAGFAGKFVLQGSTSGTGQISSAITSGTTVTISLDKQGTGTWILLGSNTYTGATTINAGTLQIGNGSTTGALSGSSAISGSAGGTLAFNRSNTVTQGTDFNNVIGGAISLRQLGSGTLLLNGANTYTGTTSINAGTLALAAGGSFANSAAIIVGAAGSSGAVLDLTAKSGVFSIGAGQLLGGGGTARLASSGTLNVAGTFSPGNSPGLFTYDGGTTLLSGTTLMEIFGTSRATSPSHGTGFYDAVNVVDNGILQFGGQLTLEFSSLFDDNTSFDLFTPATGSSLTGNFTGVNVGGGFYTGLSWNLTGSTWKSSNTAGGQSLEFNATSGQLVIVPEPHAITIGLVGIGAVAVGRRFRRRRA
jgi:autotransporter-associated beta strand protein